MPRPKGSSNRGYSLEPIPQKTGKPHWHVRIWVDDPEHPGTRKRQAVGTFGNKGQAQRGGANAVAQREGGTLLAPDDTAVGRLLDRWLNDVAAHRVRDTTLEDYRATVENHIRPAIGSIPVQRLTAARVQEFLSAKLAAGVGARTVQLCYLRLNQALAQAVRWGIVPRSVCTLVEPPRVTTKKGEPWSRGEPWSVAEAQQFLAAVDADATRTKPTPRPAELALWPLWQLAISTGMRKGELLGLRWRDIELDRRTLRVEQCVAVLDAKLVIVEPKTDAARRTVALTPEAVEALKNHRLRWLERQLAAAEWDGDLVFATATGQPIHPSNVDRTFARLLKLSGVRRVRFHDLRHFAATQMISAGVPIPTVAAQLGHANPSITMRVYAHVLDGQQEKAANIMSALLSRPG